MINLPDESVGIAMSRSHDDVTEHTEQFLTGGPDALNSCNELHDSSDQHSVMQPKHLQPPASLQNHSRGHWSTVISNGCDHQRSPTSSTTSLIPRRFPNPPSLKFEGTSLPDIGEEDDVRSQGGNGIVTTPAASSVGQLTPQLADDASTIYTVDDESECVLGSDLESRAERKLESAKQRLTDMEGNLSLAYTTSLPLIQVDDSAAIPSSNQSETSSQQQGQNNNSKEDPHKNIGAKHTPPINEYALIPSVSNNKSSNAHHAYRHDHDNTASDSPPKARQRTTSLAEALMRRTALKLKTGQPTSNADSESDMHCDNLLSLPGKSYLDRTENRHSLPVGLYKSPQMKPKMSHNSMIGRASSASELQSSFYSKPTHLQTPYRSRSSLTIHTGELGPSMGLAKPFGSVPRKQSSSSIPCEPNYIHRSRSQNLRQSHQYKVHVTPSASTLSARYQHSSTLSVGDSSGMITMPTDPVSRAEQVRDLKDQVTDLKIKISTLKVKTQADSLRRRNDEHATKYSKDSTERPSLFTDARQTTNQNGFMNHSNYTKAQKGLRIGGEEPLDILLGPIDREVTSKAALQNRSQLVSADPNQKSDRLPFDRLPPLQELNSPPDTRTQSPGGYRNNPQSPNKQDPINCYSPQEQPVAADSVDTLQDNQSSSAEATSQYEKGHRDSGDSKSEISNSAGYDEFRFYGDQGEIQDAKEEEDEVNAWDGGSNGSSSTRNLTSAECSESKTSESGKQQKGIFKRASSAGDVYRHRRVTWSDDLGYDDSKTSIGDDSRRHVRRSTSEAIIAATSYEDHLDSLRRAHSNTLHRKSQRFQHIGKNNHWASSDSEDEHVLQSDHTDDGNVTTPHEEREDAFDYQHFLLHTAVGDYAIPTESETSVIETDDGDDVDDDDDDDDDNDDDDDDDDDEAQDEPAVADGNSAESEASDNKDSDDRENSNDGNTVVTAKSEGNDKPCSSRAPSQDAPSHTQESAGERYHLTPTTARMTSSNGSHESLSTTMTSETASRGRESADEATANEKPVRHRRNSSGKTIPGHHATGSIGNSGAVRYKFSSIRNASSPTVLIQPHPIEGRASSRASVTSRRSRGLSVQPRTADRGVQTSPDRLKCQSAKAIPSRLPTDSECMPSYSAPHPKVATSSLRLQMETGVLSSSSSTRTTDSGIFASTSSVTGSTGMIAPKAAKASSQAHSSQSQNLFRSALDSPLSTGNGSITSPKAPAPGSPMPDLQEVVTSLITTAASRYAPTSVTNNNGNQLPEHADSLQNDHPDPSLTQLEDEDLTRLSALFTSIGQLAFRLQVSLAEQAKQWPLPPDHSPSTPSSHSSSGIAQSSSSARATNVLRARLDAARRVLDGKLEIPPRQQK